MVEGVFQLVQVNTKRCLMNYLLGFSSVFFVHTLHTCFSRAISTGKLCIKSKRSPMKCAVLFLGKSCVLLHMAHHYLACPLTGLFPDFVPQPEVNCSFVKMFSVSRTLLILQIHDFESDHILHTQAVVILTLSKQSRL